MTSLVIAWIDVSQDASGLPPWETPVMIAERRFLFLSFLFFSFLFFSFLFFSFLFFSFLFFSFLPSDVIKQKLNSLWSETVT